MPRMLQAGLQSELESATAEIERTTQRLTTLEREKQRIKVQSTQCCESFLRFVQSRYATYHSWCWRYVAQSIFSAGQN